MFDSLLKVLGQDFYTCILFVHEQEITSSGRVNNWSGQTKAEKNTHYFSWLVHWYFSPTDPEDKKSTTRSRGWYNDTLIELTKINSVFDFEMVTWQIFVLCENIILTNVIVYKT